MPTTKKDGRTFHSGWSGLTYTDIQSFIGRTLNVTQQGVVTGIIASKEAEIASKCNRNFGDSSLFTYEEKFACGSDCYYLQNSPINEITNISIDGNNKYIKGNPSQSTYVLYQDFDVDDVKVNFYTVDESSVYNSRALVIEYSISKFWNVDVIDVLKKMVSAEYLAREYGGIEPNVLSSAGITINLNTLKFEKELADLIARYRVVNM